MSVVLTMTTIPDRLSNGLLKKCVDRLLNLSYEDYELHFNIPSHYKKSNQEYVIPQWMRDIDNPKLKLFTGVEDHGPITKIVSTIQRITDPNTVIITVDDDLEYMDGFIEYHLEKRKQYPNSALGFAGICAYDGSIHFATSVEKDVSVKLLENYKTVSYLRSFFEDDFFTDFVEKHWADDLVLSAYMAKQNIERIVLRYDQDTDFTPRVQSFPVIDHLPFDRSLGCNLFRQENNQNYHDIEDGLYKKYIDKE